MKYLMLFIMIGCVTANGTFEGKLTQAEWSGRTMKSCEVQFHVESVVYQCSTLDYRLCDKLQNLTQKELKVEYSELWYESGYMLGTDTTCKINSITEIK